MQKKSTPFIWLFTALTFFLFGQPNLAHAQLTYDFSTAPTIVPGNPWNTQAKIVLGGITYLLSTGGNGSFVYSSSGGNGNSACLNKAIVFRNKTLWRNKKSSSGYLRENADSNPKRAGS